MIVGTGEALLSFKVDSWQNDVDRNVAGRTARRVLSYNGSGAHLPADDRRGRQGRLPLIRAPLMHGIRQLVPR